MFVLHMSPWSNGTGRKYETETNFDGKVIETTLKTKDDIQFVTNYDYDRKGRLSLQTDYRGLRTLFSYNFATPALA